jgi:hypothetical protein
MTFQWIGDFCLFIQKKERCFPQHFSHENKTTEAFYDKEAFFFELIMIWTTNKYYHPFIINYKDVPWINEKKNTSETEQNYITKTFVVEARTKLPYFNKIMEWVKSTFRLFHYCSDLIKNKVTSADMIFPFFHF